MSETIEKLPFEADVKRVLDIVIGSLYTHKEIFLRELISNASDALDKRRFAALTKPELFPTEEKGSIRLLADKKARTLTVKDNGIGMSKAEMTKNLGTIAKSGTKDFIKRLNEAKDAPNLIGQFGVGFYSAFMVADEIRVETCKAGSKKGYVWTCKGDSGFTIEEKSGLDIGTAIVLQLKKQEPGEQDFTDSGMLTSVVRKYSNYINYPVTLGDAPEALNSMKAIWTKKAKDITAEEHNEFYRHIAKDWNDPLEPIRFSAEGASLSYEALLYLPEVSTSSMFMPERRGGLQFYVNRVLITDECQDLTPDWLRFVRGVVDCPDVSLNISRETMQHEPKLKAIRTRIESKVLDSLKKLKNGEQEKYSKFWKTFGKVVKEGLYSDEKTQKSIRDLMLFETTATKAGEYASFADYIGRMQKGQDEIFYINGESRAALEGSPYLEALKAKGWEVIFFTDAVDEVVISRIEDVEGKKLRAAGKGEIKLSEEDEKKKAARVEEHKDLLAALQTKLDDRVKEVRFSDRLTESAVCLVPDENAMSAQLEAILKRSQQDVPENKRILELNPTHPVVAKLKKMFEADAKDAALTDYAELLYGQGALTEGSPLPDPAAYARLVAKLMAADA
jgi:molecular chaperone HtpG